MTKYLLFLELITLSYLSIGQTTITGRILDHKDKKGIDSVLVKRVSDRKEISSNHLGFFQLSVDPEEQLTLHKEGYYDVTFPVPNQTSFQISLKRMQLDTPEYYLGNVEFYKFLAQNLRYPDKAYEQKISGRIICAFQIDTVGNVQNITFLNEMGGGIEEEIRRVISQTPYIWIPCKFTFDFTIPVTFKLINSRFDARNYQLEQSKGTMLSEVLITR